MTSMKKTTVMSISIPYELRMQVKELARKEGRNTSNMVAELIRRGIQNGKAA